MIICCIILVWLVRAITYTLHQIVITLMTLILLNHYLIYCRLARLSRWKYRWWCLLYYLGRGSLPTNIDNKWLRIVYRRHFTWPRLLSWRNRRLLDDIERIFSNYFVAVTLNFLTHLYLSLLLLLFPTCISYINFETTRIQFLFQRHGNHSFL